MKKKCSKCKKVKKLGEFYKDKGKRDGYKYNCKECNKKYNSEHEDEIKEYHRNRYLENRDKILEQQKGYYLENRDKILEDAKQYRLEHIDESKKYAEKYRSEHKEKKKGYNKKYWEKWYSENRTDSMFRLNRSIGYGIWYSLKGNKDGKHWESLVPYTLKDLIRHLEKQFSKGMTWENYGSKWHVDHRRPISSFKFKSHKDLQFQICWALSNLRPMWGPENISKGNKIIEGYQMLLEV